MTNGELAKVRSLESIGTISQDVDVGVVRVAGTRLQELGARNAPVRVSTMKRGRPEKSLVRIAGAKTTEPPLKTDEIALQHDDRQALGIGSAAEQRGIPVEEVRQFSALPRFLLSHASPLVKKEACLAVASMTVGALAGGVAGFRPGLLVP